MPDTITIRHVAGSDELRAFFGLATQTFMRDAPPGAVDNWVRYATGHPRFYPGTLRGAFRGDEYVGGYIIDERVLQLGRSRTRAGCIGVVVVHPDHRKQGIGTMLMRDALDYAHQRGLTTLLLHGALHFYDPFGFIDVFDRIEHTVSCAPIQARLPSPYTVRPATPDDAPAMSDLYQRQYGTYPGSYERPVAEHAYNIAFAATVEGSLYRWQNDLSYQAPVVVVDETGVPRGYLTVPWGALRPFGCEVAADDWPAALALLQYHARLLGSLAGGSDQVRWPLPPTSPAYYALADNIYVASETRAQPHGGWMASIVDLPVLIQDMLLEWNTRWHRGGTSWTGSLDLTIGDDAVALTVDAAGVRLHDHAPAGALAVRLERSVFTRLLFGYRPISWAISQPGTHVPAEVIPALEVLMHTMPAWIAPVDGA